MQENPFRGDMSMETETGIKVITDLNGEEALEILVEANLSAEINRKSQKTNRTYAGVCIFFGVMDILVVGLMGMNYSLLLLIGAAAVVLGAVLLFMTSDRRIRKRLRDMITSTCHPSAYTGHKEYEFSDAGVTCSSPGRTFHYDWSAVNEWSRCGDYLCLATNDGRLLMLDARQMSTGEKSDLEDLLKEKIG